MYDTPNSRMQQIEKGQNVPFPPRHSPLLSILVMSHVQNKTDPSNPAILT